MVVADGRFQARFRVEEAIPDWNSAETGGPIRPCIARAPTRPCHGATGDVQSPPASNWRPLVARHKSVNPRMLCIRLPNMLPHLFAALHPQT